MPPVETVVAETTEPAENRLDGTRAITRAIPIVPDLGNGRRSFDWVVAVFATSRDQGLERSRSLLADLELTQPPPGADAAHRRSSYHLCRHRRCGRFGGSSRSVLWAAWPDWESDSAGMRAALRGLRRTTEVYRPTLSTSDVMPFVEAMSLETIPIDSPDDPWAETFRAGLTTWSMPYRGREGRSRRFVAVGHANGITVPIGLLEVGDDAPHNPLRDAMLGLTVPAKSDKAADALEAPDSFADWVRSRGSAAVVCGDVAQRLAAIRALLGPTPGVDATAPAHALFASIGRLRELGNGRSGTAEEIDLRKRYSYLARLVNGEIAMRRGDTDGPAARDAVRVIRDLSVPRVQVEATVCGALPPFGPALVGKLVAGLFGHPLVRDVVDRQVGFITRRMFNPQIERLLPRHGALLVTTKGLFAGHSAQYNNVKLPGLMPIPLRRIGVTSGITTSLLSERTARYAEGLLGHAPEKAISREFGSGGGKRQRTIETAAIFSGLPQAVVHARVKRPTYAARFVRNLPDVIILGDEPDWLIDRAQTPAAYDADVLTLWRSRWLEVARRRMAGGG